MKRTLQIILSATPWLGIWLLVALPLPSLAQQVEMELLKALKPRNVGPAGMSGRVTSIDVVRDQPEIIYVGTASGGLWKSESGGIAWEPIFDKERVASIGDVTIDPTNPDVIWAGTGEGNPRNSQTNGYGIYKSLDGGKNWKLMGLEETRNIHRVLVNPNNPDEVYVAAIGTAWGDTQARGVYKTTDGGKTWNKILYINDRTGAADMVMDPKNPDKLLVAMWEYRRWPWFFKSGGEGSGLYVTYDGGENWTERTSEDGLPEGELGRIGLAIAPSDPDVVYALIESKKNALYRSNDGGEKWQMINNKEEIGNRPFYYSDIFVDPQNENRLYSLHSLVSVSDDGGKSFRVLLPYSGVHPDHHAWYIHPDNPKFMMDGNDGGLNITHDRGENWRFVENLPLAQFYHINIDNDTPYNIYGGMQDNGSWRGPAYVWRQGGVRNSYWEELFFGDGFDVVPYPEDSKQGYAMSQGGFVGRYNLETSQVKLIRPVHPEGTELRYNWNAGIAQDPFDANTIYYGSQFVHKSTDRGESWEIISPDLTTNDPEKQKQGESGGLTFDVTNAENYTTIISIAPSPHEQGVIWVGTDDGNVQLTRDGGKTWTNHAPKLKGVPKGSWIPQIVVSPHNKGEAYVVINNYRRNDYNPYLYRTRDYGQSWERLVDGNDLFGYVLSVAQDPEEPNLLFMGGEYGLYVSIDGGSNWTKWGEGYPTVSTMDMKIHPEEGDLILGTFGRSAWVLDDICPLRELARTNGNALQQTVTMYEPKQAVLALYSQASGTRFAADAHFEGENRPDGAMLTYSVKEGRKDMQERMKKEKKAESEDEDKEKKPEEKAKIEILDASGEVIRTMKHEPETGMNRMVWELYRKSPRYPSQPEPKDKDDESAYIPVAPGTYTVRVTWQGATDSAVIRVVPDPRMDVSEQQLAARHEAFMRHATLVQATTAAADRLRNATRTVEKVSSLIPEEEKEGAPYKALVKRNQEVQDTLKKMIELINPREDVQGIFRDTELMSSRLGIMNYYLFGTYEEMNPNQKYLAEQVRGELEKLLEQVNSYFEKEWPEYRNMVNEAELSPFEDYEPIRIETSLD